MTTFIGCDPGSTGAICILAINDFGPTTVSFIDNKESDLTIYNLLTKVHRQDFVKMAMLEEVHSLKLVSAKSNFVFGGNFIRVKTLLNLQEFGLDMVQPKEWQKVTGIMVPKVPKGEYDTKAQIKARATKRAKDLKLKVAEVCERLYPGCEIRGPQGGLKDGKSDALMIAHYCYLKYK